MSGAITIAALFPGVGSERPGMAAPYYDRYAVVRQTFAEASDVLDLDVARACLDKTAPNRLDSQVAAQLAIFVTSVALYRAVEAEVGLPISHFAGHSLGEYSALCCAGALSFVDALALVRLRGEAISATAATLDGSMAWVMGLEVDRVANICRFWNEEGRLVFPAIIDGPRQVALAGRREDVRHVGAECENRGGRVVPLRLTGPFHSPMIGGAAEQMKRVVSGVTVKPTSAPVYSNVNAQPHPGGTASAQLLVEQLVSPVQWYGIQQKLVAEGVGLALEIGPGNVLSFIIGNNGGHLRSRAVDDYQDLGAFGEALRLGPADAGSLLDECVRVAVTTPSWRPETALSQHFERLESARREMNGDDDSRSRSVAEGLAALDDLLAAKGLNERERLRKLAGVTRGRVLAA